MSKSDQSLNKPSTTPAKWLLYAIAAFAFIGFLDTSYLTVSHFTGTDVSCTITGGCSEVLSSEYSTIFGIPLALLGLIHYTIILIAALYYLDSHKKLVLKFLSIISIFGFLFSGWLVYLQFFVLESICQYCMVSAINSVFLLILGLKLIPNWYKK